MIPPSPWHQLPSAPVMAALADLRWQPDHDTPASAATAALMLYVVLNFLARPTTLADGSATRVSEASYDALGDATGLSRSLIAGGLKRLQRLGLVTATGSAQRRGYVITGPHDRWFKLPCRAILRDGVLRPFTTFTMRTKHELHAMKLYLYLAAVRPNVSESTMASYERIHERTGVPENDIRRAINVLNASGLLINIDREYSRTLKVNEANKYYLTGHYELVPRRQAAKAGGDTATADFS